jgi:hypothetical protein
MRRVVFVEGLPGSGKTTLARRLCEAEREAGRASEWHLEEAADHPVHPHSLGACRTHDNYASLCLQSWQRFAGRSESEDRLQILEGSALQSTVRFMMEQERDRQGIADYFVRFEEIVGPLQPGFIYLRPADAEIHSQAIAQFRGPDWTCKVAAYIEQTPYARRRGLRGEAGMHRFWADYAQLCDALVAGLSMPVTRLAPAPQPR